MSTLLFIESSPRKGASASTAISHAFLDAYRRVHPHDTIDTMDLWRTDIPEFDG